MIILKFYAAQAASVALVFLVVYVSLLGKKRSDVPEPNVDLE